MFLFFVLLFLFLIFLYFCIFFVCLFLFISPDISCEGIRLGIQIISLSNPAEFV